MRSYLFLVRAALTFLVSYASTPRVSDGGPRRPVRPQKTAETKLLAPASAVTTWFYNAAVPQQEKRSYTPEKLFWIKPPKYPKTAYRPRWPLVRGVWRTWSFFTLQSPRQYYRGFDCRILAPKLKPIYFGAKHVFFITSALPQQPTHATGIVVYPTYRRVGAISNIDAVSTAFRAQWASLLSGMWGQNKAAIFGGYRETTTRNLVQLPHLRPTSTDDTVTGTREFDQTSILLKTRRLSDSESSDTVKFAMHSIDLISDIVPTYALNFGHARNLCVEGVADLENDVDMPGAHANEAANAAADAACETSLPVTTNFWPYDWLDFDLKPTPAATFVRAATTPWVVSGVLRPFMASLGICQSAGAVLSAASSLSSALVNAGGLDGNDPVWLLSFDPANPPVSNVFNLWGVAPSTLLQNQPLVVKKQKAGVVSRLYPEPYAGALGVSAALEVNTHKLTTTDNITRVLMFILISSVADRKA